MYFLYPAFLFALAAVAIPIIIHLFRFRRFKTVYFTNVRYLKEVKETTATYSRLKHLLVLFARILTIIFLVFAFAQPYLSPEKGNKTTVTQQENVSIYVDNSFSMGAVGEQGGLLDGAKQRAKEILEVYPPSVRFQLLTNAFKGAHQRLVDRDRFIAELEEVQLSPDSRKLSEVLERQQQVLQEENKKGVAYILSDFQQTMTDLEALGQVDSNLDVSLIPLRGQQPSNIYIDSCWFEVPILRINHVTRLNVRLKNTGDQAIYDVRLAMKENDRIKAIANLDLPAHTAKVDTLSFTIKQTGWHNASLVINDDPITFDDTYYLTFEVTPQVRVLSIREDTANKYINAVFRADDYFVHEDQSVHQLDYSNFSNFQLIILDELKEISSGLASELKKFVEKGGDLLVFPHPQANRSTYRQALTALRTDYYTGLKEQERRVSEINVRSNVFRDVFESLPDNIDLPVAQKSFGLSDLTQTQQEPLLTFRDGQPLVAGYIHQKGKVYLSAVPLRKRFSNLPTHAVFVPMLYKIALLSNDPKPLAYFIGQQPVIEVNKTTKESEQLFRLQRNDFEIIPEQRTLGTKTLLSVHQQVEEAGIYEITQDENPDYERYVAFNYDRDESDLRYVSLEKLKNRTQQYANVNVLNTLDKKVARSIAEKNRGTPLWKLCIIFALLFLLTEILLIRFWPQPKESAT